MVKPIIDIFPDVPHIYQKLLQQSLIEGRTKPCITDLPGACYKSTNKDNYNDVTFEKAIVCNKPTGINSGSHRILIHGTYKGERYVMSVEEKESFFCSPRGDIIRISSYSEAGAKTLEAGKERLPIELLSSFIFISTGHSATYPEYVCKNTMLRKALSGTTYFPRFLIRIDNPYAIEARGCRLTKEASSCFLIF